MNKYTLKFINLDLERQYQSSRLQLVPPFFQVLNGITLLMCVMKIILQFLYQDLTGIAIFSGASFVLLIAQYSLMKCKRNWIDNYLLVLNHIAMLYQVYLEVGFEPQEAFVFGQNQMVMHLVTILVSDFIPAVIQIVGNTAIKIGIAFYFQPSFSYSTLLYTFIVCVAMLFTIYKINQQYRRSFLFTTSDNMQEQMIPILIDNPFVVCNYDNKNIQFRIKYSNLQNYDEFKKYKTLNECVQHLIRNYNIYGQSLESFLISRQKLHTSLLINKILLATDSKTQYIIRYYEYEFTEFTSVLIIDQKEKQIQSLQNKHQIMEKKIIAFSTQLHKFIVRLSNLLSKPEIQKKSIYQAKVNLMQFLMKFEKNIETKVQPYKIIQKMSQFISLYQLAYGDRVIFNQEPIEIITNPSLFNSFFTLLMTILFKIKSTYIEIELCTNSEFEEQLDVCVKIDYPSQLYTLLQKCTHLRKVLKQIGPYDYIQMDREKIIISLYKNMNEINLIRSFRFEVLND